MAEQHIWQLKNNPMLQDAKQEFKREDFSYYASAEPERFVIEGFAAKTLMMTTSYDNPNAEQGTIFSQVAIRPRLRSVVSLRWPLPNDKRAALLAAVAKCQEDPIENTDPAGCLASAAKKLGIDMDVKPDASSNAVNAVIKLPTGDKLPGRALVEPASLWFGVRVCRKGLTGSAPAVPPAPAAPPAQ
jgi:hypothetical protein